MGGSSSSFDMSEMMCQPCCGQFDPQTHRVGGNRSSKFSRTSAFVRPPTGHVHLRYVGLALPTAEPQALLLEEVESCSSSSSTSGSSSSAAIVAPVRQRGAQRTSINVQHNFPAAPEEEEVANCSGSGPAAQLPLPPPPAVCWHKFEVASPRRTTLSLVTHRHVAGRVEKIDEFVMEVPAFSMWQFGICLGLTSLEAISSAGTHKTVATFDDSSLWDVHHRWTQVDRVLDSVSFDRLKAGASKLLGVSGDDTFQLLRFALVPRVAGRVRFTDVSIEDLEFQVNDRVYDATTYPYPVYTISLVNHR